MRISHRHPANGIHRTRKRSPGNHGPQQTTRRRPGNVLLCIPTHSSNRNPIHDLIGTSDTFAVWARMTSGPRAKCTSRKKRWLSTYSSHQQIPGIRAGFVPPFQPIPAFPGPAHFKAAMTSSSTASGRNAGTQRTSDTNQCSKDRCASSTRYKNSPTKEYSCWINTVTEPY